MKSLISQRIFHKVKMILLVIFAIFSFSSILYAYDLPVHSGTDVVIVSMPRVETLRKVLVSLNLTEKQKMKIRKIMLSGEIKFRNYLMQDELNSQALSLLWGNRYDAKKINQLATEQGKIAADAIKLRFEIRHEIYNILTVSQRKMVENIPY